MAYTFINKLSAATGFSELDLLKIAANAPERYKVYRIPKRSGGWREIAQPAKELKLIQRAIIDDLLSALPVHKSATAYVKGRSIADNAALHATKSPILKMDFKDFFLRLFPTTGSITAYGTA